MPGIVGLITALPRERAEAELLRMVGALQHQSFYVAGTCIDERLRLYVGWVARRGSFAAGMPLHNEQGDLSLFFSGEEFPDPGLEAGLKERGHSFEPGGASYLVHRAEEEADFPRELNGRFHGCLANRATGDVTVFNDRYGMHRLYYHEGKDAFYFAAEAKAILAVRPELRAIDAQGLAEFITCGCALENRTLFRDIHVLPPGSVWTFRNGSLQRKAAYFDPKEWEEQPVLDEENYYQQLRSVFARTLPGYFGGREKIGMSLTGGLDSRMILSWHHAEPGSLPCYSFVGPYRECQDVLMARKVARACGQPHQVIAVGQDFLSQFASYSERTVFLTDGCLEVKHAPDLYVNERAAQIAPVRMTGNYGGEVLRAVRAFKPVDPAPGLFASDLAPDFEKAKQAYRRQLDGHPLSFAVFRQAPWHHYGLLCLEQSQLTLRSPYIDNEFVKTVFRAPKSTLASNDISLRIIQEGDPALRKIRTDRGLGGSLPRWMASPLEKYLEFTFKAEYAYDYGMPQPVAKVDHALSALHLERLFLGRHKFYHYRVWYRDPLAAYVREMLLDSRTLSRPWLQRNTLEEIVKGHLKGDRNYTTAIHKILTLEHVHRLFIDSR
ncbi:MAG: asparagine synthase-related protein [Acidobacteriaceae bacterium]